MPVVGIGVNIMRFVGVGAWVFVTVGFGACAGVFVGIGVGLSRIIVTVIFRDVPLKLVPLISNTYGPLISFEWNSI
jgi:hypothetical protein